MMAFVVVTRSYRSCPQRVASSTQRETVVRAITTPTSWCLIKVCLVVVPQITIQTPNFAYAVYLRHNDTSFRQTHFVLYKYRYTACCICVLLYNPCFCFLLYFSLLSFRYFLRHNKETWVLGVHITERTRYLFLKPNRAQLNNISGSLGEYSESGHVVLSKLH